MAVIEYVGEVLSKIEALKRSNEYLKAGPVRACHWIVRGIPRRARPQTRARWLEALNLNPDQPLMIQGFRVYGLWLWVTRPWPSHSVAVFPQTLSLV